MFQNLWTPVNRKFYSFTSVLNILLTKKYYDLWMYAVCYPKPLASFHASTLARLVKFRLRIRLKRLGNYYQHMFFISLCGMRETRGELLPLHRPTDSHVRIVPEHQNPTTLTCDHESTKKI